MKSPGDAHRLFDAVPGPLRAPVAATPVTTATATTATSAGGTGLADLVGNVIAGRLIDDTH